MPTFLGQKKSVWMLCFLFLLAGAAAGWLAKSQFSQAQGGVSSCAMKSVREGGYQLIKPLLLCEVTGKQDFFQLEPLQNTITRFLESKKTAKILTKASVYFRDYSRGKWMDIYGEEAYAPASLVKVPVMLAWLRLAQSQPDILSRTLKFQENVDYNQMEYFQSPNSIKMGKPYTVEELISKMIKYSDNNAYALLVDNINPDLLSEVFIDLGLDIPSVPLAPDDMDFIRVKSYAYFFRILYNATYLPRDLSEKALLWLSQTDFRGGLVEGTPADITITHKFGEAMVPGTEGLKELHDCGIVYYPSRPYLLCVMTQGYDLEELRKVIQAVARFSYEEMGKYVMPS